MFILHTVNLPHGHKKKNRNFIRLVAYATKVSVIPAYRILSDSAISLAAGLLLIMVR